MENTSLESLIEELNDYRTTLRELIERKVSTQEDVEKLELDERILVERNDAAQKTFDFIILKLKKLQNDTN